MNVNKNRVILDVQPMVKSENWKVKKSSITTTC
jgi:hypothetical protein